MFKPKELLKVKVVIKKENIDKILDSLIKENLIHLDKLDFEVDGNKDNLRRGKFQELEKEYLDFSSVVKWALLNRLIDEDEIYMFFEKKEFDLDLKKLNNSHSIIIKILNNLNEYNKLKNNIKYKKEYLIILKLLLKLYKKKLIKNIKDLEKEFNLLIKKEDLDNVSFKNIEFRYDLEEDGRKFSFVKVNEASYDNLEDRNLFQQHLHKIKEIGDLKSLDAIINKVNNELIEENKRLNELLNETKNLFLKNKYDLIKTYLSLRKEFVKYNALDYTFESKKLAIISGFIPKERRNDFEKIVRLVENNAIIEFEEIKDGPTLIEHKKLKEFKSLVEQYGIVKYGWFDPTILFAFMFSFFYGFIIGDLGYGFLMLVIAFFAYKFFNNLMVAKILSFAAISSMFFGYVYGEFFGDLGNTLP